MTKNESTWFTIDRIDAQTFALSEYGHWEQTHTYLFVGSRIAALVDTGTGIGNIYRAVRRLTALPLLVLTTHCHWDHIGGHRYFEDIAIHSADRDWLEHGLPLPLAMIKGLLLKEPLTLAPPEDFSIDSYSVYTGVPRHILHDGDTFDLGGRELRVLHTPGHSPGHVCIHEPQRGYLASGDLLYEGTLYANYPSTDPEAFYTSLRRLANLSGVEKLLPGHNRLDVPLSLLCDTLSLFDSVERRGELHQGSGLHRAAAVSLLL